MTCNEHEMLTMFLKIKPLVFLGLERQNAYEFILDWYNSLNKFGIIYQYGVEFVSYKLLCEANQW